MTPVENPHQKKGLSFPLAIVLLFVILSAVLYLIAKQWQGASFVVLVIANVILACVSLASFYMVKQKVTAKPQSFIGGVYSGTFLKLGVCIAATLVYVLGFRQYVHKPSFFIFFGLYIIYTFVETRALFPLAKGRQNA